MPIPNAPRNNRLGLRLVSGLCALLLPLAHAQRGDTPAAKLLSPEEERARFHLPPGFEIQLVASEPGIQKPMNINFDAAGRVWVTGSQMYPWPAKTDLLGETIKTFEQNAEENTTAFRGLAMPPPPALAGSDTVRVLSDFGPDGRARRVATFAEGLNIPIGIQPLPRRPGSKGDTVIVFSIPAIWRLEDTDGDGRADSRQKLYDGFGFGDTHGMSSNYLLWLDGWIYGTHGFKNRSEILDPRSGKHVVLTSGNTFRFRPDGSEFQHWVVGQTNPFGLAFDPRGDLYSADSHSKPVYLLLRVGFYEGGGKKHDGLGFAPAITADDHGSSSIAGIAYYAAEQFPEEYRGNLFNGNPVTRRVNRARLDWSGSSPQAVRVADFLTSDDPSFRPVQVKLGPDGALWIADFYNPIVGHYEVPLAHPNRDKAHGRIWRIVWRGLDKNVPPPGLPDFALADARALSTKLSDPNLTVRVLATNDLVDRIGAPAIPGLRDLAKKVFPEPGAPASFPVAAALERLGANDDELLFKTLAGAGDDTAVAAFRILGERPNLGALDEAYFTRLIGRTRPGILWRQLADVFARHPQPWQAPLVLNMHLKSPVVDTQLRYSLSAAMKQQVLRASLAQHETWGGRELSTEKFVADVCLAAGTPAAAEFLLGHLERTNFAAARTGDFIRHAAMHFPPDRFAVIASLVERLRSGFSNDQQLALAEGLAAAAQRPDITLSRELHTWMVQTLMDSIALGDATLTPRAITAVEKLNLPEKNRPLGLLALNLNVAPPIRRAALNALELNAAGVETLLTLIRRNVDPKEELAQKLAADRLNKLPDTPAVRAAFSQAMPTASTNLAVSLAAGLARTDEGAAELVRLVESGKAPAALLRHFWVSRPLEQRAQPLQDRIAALTKALPSEDVRLEGVVRQRAAAFPTVRPNVGRGAEVFRQNCALCHRFRNEGSNIAPSLDGLASRGVMRVIEDILDPNRNVDPAYRLATVTTRSGASHSGMNFRDLGDKVLLTHAVTGEDIVIPRANIGEVTRLATTPMPPVFEHAIPEKEFYDLLGYLIGESGEPAKVTQK
ncbi:MAG: hypothetical protein EXS38_12145 [Opitutus sp.]|nr:hypothetical protein [Opitutus sp.]